MRRSVEFDEIGYWSELKLEIIGAYASAYSKILTSKKLPHIYVDAFAGAGQHISRSSGETISGSPTIALAIDPPFREYHFIDLSSAKVGNLQRLAGSRRGVRIYEGDCNKVLVEQIFPTLAYESRRRALCLLDPYGLDLEWKVILQAGQLGTVDMFLNFPVMDMNRTALWRNPDRVAPDMVARMTTYWGDESDWRKAAYTTERSLFGELEKESNDVVARAFQRRLRKVAGFKRVPDPLPMRNSIGAIVYYLFFASQVDVAERIVVDIFNKFRNVGEH
jgi:three-Cys-motif partner protein